MIAYDAQSNSWSSSWTWSNWTTCTWSHTCSWSDRLLIVWTYGYFTSWWPRAVTWVTYNWVALTNISSINWTADSVTQWTELWYLVAPATWANNIVITWSWNAQYASGSWISYTWVNQSSPIDSYATGQSSSTGSWSQSSLTLTTTVVDSNCWLTWFITARSVNPTAWTWTTLRGQNTSTVSTWWDSNGTVSTGSRSLVWNWTTPYPWGVIASIKPLVLSTNNWFFNFF